MSENFTDLVKDTCLDSRRPVKSIQDKHPQNYTRIVIKLLKTKGEEQLP